MRFSFLRERSLLLAFIVLAISSCTSRKETLTNSSVLTVNDQSLSVKEFGERLGRRLKSFDALYAKHEQNIRRLKEEVIEEFITESLIEQYALTNGLGVTNEELEREVQGIRKQYPDDISFRGAFAATGLSMEQWKARLKRSLLEKAVFAQATQSVPEPTDAEMQAYYKENLEKFRQAERIHLKQIVIEKEDDARRILDELRKGASFDKLAREFSLGPESVKGGDAGWVERGTLEAFDAAFSLPKKKLSALVKSPYGHHIFYVLDKKPASQLKFDQARATILSTLRSSREREASLAWLKKELQRARVFRNDALIESVKVHTEIE